MSDDNSAEFERDLLGDMMEVVSRLVRFNHVNNMKFGNLGDLMAAKEDFLQNLKELERIYVEINKDKG